MTSNVIMEELSRSYMEVIANNSGYFNSTARDYGTDLTIRKANLCPTRKRYLTSGKAVDIQLKAVSEKYVIGINDPHKTYIKFKLEVKNYNDLVDRSRENGRIIPLILAVFILPNIPTDYILHTPEHLMLKRCAYWYEIPDGADYAKNKSKSVITIPKTSLITTDFFNTLFSKID